MRGNVGTIGIIIVFLCSFFSFWIPIPPLLINGLSVVLLEYITLNILINHRSKKQIIPKGFWCMGAVCVFVILGNLWLSGLLWQMVYLLCIYSFFIWSGYLTTGRINRISVLLCVGFMGTKIIQYITTNDVVIWIFMILQLILVMRMLNPVFEAMAHHHRDKRLEKGLLEEKKVSVVRKILFGKTGKFQFPGIIR